MVTVFVIPTETLTSGQGHTFKANSLVRFVWCPVSKLNRLLTTYPKPMSFFESVSCPNPKISCKEKFILLNYVHLKVLNINSLSTINT